MSGEQLDLNVRDRLPDAFAQRWRQLGGGAITPVSVVKGRAGRWWIVVDTAAGRFVLANRADLRAAAESLFEMTRGRR